MSKTRKHETRVELRADPETVWKEIAEAEGLKRWFALDARFDGKTVWVSWGPGMEAPFGEMRDIDPPRRLVWGDDSPTGLVTEFLLEGSGGRTTLRIIASGFDGEGWENEYEATRRGWRVLATQLKHSLERHPGQPRLAMMVMGKPAIPSSEVWLRIRDALGEPGPVAESTPGESMSFVLPDLGDGLLAIEVGPGEGSCGMSATVSAYGPNPPREAVVAWSDRMAAILQTL